MNYLGLDDVLTIAAAVLRVEPEVLVRTSRITKIACGELRSRWPT